MSYDKDYKIISDTLKQSIYLSLLSPVTFFLVVVSLFLPLIAGVFIYSCIVSLWVIIWSRTFKLLFHIKRFFNENA